MGRKEIKPLQAKTGLFLKTVMDASKAEQREDTVLTKYSKASSDVKKLSIHHLLLNFFEIKRGGMSADEFMVFCAKTLSTEICYQASCETVEQSQNSLWHYLRYGRITASKAYEATRCKTIDGSLVERVLGAKCIKDTVAMAYGRDLEKDVIKQVEKEMKIKISPCGFMTSPEIPVMGASPDGITDDFVIEVKCPMTEERKKEYIYDNKIKDRYFAQVQMQIFFFFEKRQALFCLASEDFKISKKVLIKIVPFDSLYCSNIIQNCICFWKRAIFPVLEKNYL